MACSTAMSFIGTWSDHAATFATVFGLLTLVVFSVPIFLFTRTWSRLFLWRIPEDTDLAWYFGRCLGAFAIVTDLLLLRGGLYGVGLTFTLELLGVFCAFMVVVHIWGALERTQPITETLETGFWALTLLMVLLVMPPRPDAKAAADAELGTPSDEATLAVSPR